MRRGLAPRVAVLHHVASHRGRGRESEAEGVREGWGRLGKARVCPRGPALTSLWGSVVPLVYSVLTSTRAGRVRGPGSLEGPWLLRLPPHPFLLPFLTDTLGSHLLPPPM